MTTAAATDPAPPDEDAFAELLADRLTELASRPGVHRLRLKQELGLLPPPGLITQAQVARELGITPTRASREFADATEKLLHDPDLLTLYHDLFGPAEAPEHRSPETPKPRNTEARTP